MDQIKGDVLKDATLVLWAPLPLFIVSIGSALRPHPVRSSPVTGAMILLSSGLAVLTAIGVSLLVDIQFTDLSGIMIFTVLAIGVPD